LTHDEKPNEQVIFLFLSDVAVSLIWIPSFLLYPWALRCSGQFWWITSLILKPRKSQRELSSL
jgi:hypothetical protein